MPSPGPTGFQSPRLPKPHLVINDFGGSVGGPIFRNKLFFSWQLLRAPLAQCPNRHQHHPDYRTYALRPACTSTVTSNTTGRNISSINVLAGAQGLAGLDPNVNPAITYQEKLGTRALINTAPWSPR